MSGSGLFSIARNALLTHQSALQTVSHNIANAETPGYSRQEAVLSATMPVRMPYGSVGTGVMVDTIVRHREVLLDENFRSANDLASRSGMRHDLLSGVEAMFGEPSDAGMSHALDAFFNAWSELATSPGNPAAREVLRQRGQQLAQLFNSYDSQLSRQRQSVIDRVSASVAEINSLAGQVAELNGQIVSAESSGHTAGDLRDKRDTLIDRLSQISGARAIPQQDGSVSVIVGTSTLVDSNTARTLAVELAPPNPPPAVPLADVPLRIRMGMSPDPIREIGGEMGALLDHLNTDIPDIRGRLDAMASALVAAVNTEHTQNYIFSNNSIPGTAAPDFFDAGTVASPVRASTIRLSDEVAASSSAIGISRDPQASFDNSGGLALAALREATGTVSYTNSAGVAETAGLLTFFRNMVSSLGVEVKTSGDDAEVRKVLAEQADLRRESISGVNTDEELMKMLRIQQAYTAATKLIKTADEMLDHLLSIV